MSVVNQRSLVVWALVGVACVSLVLSLALRGGRRGGGVADVLPSLPGLLGPSEPRLSPLQRAVLGVEEDRGEETGRRADVEVPAQLKHYADRRRFLAAQVAEAREQELRTPGDYAELAELIRGGELRELPPLGADYVLYGVGLTADDGPFTHYEEKTGESVALFAGDEELRAELTRLEESVKESETKIAALREESKQLDRNERARRRELQKSLTAEEKNVAAAKKRKAQLESFYNRPDARQHLAADFQLVAGLASDFGGRAYDLNDAASRKELKVRMLSFLRPAAAEVLEGVARSYRERFGRHLPVTSLVRTDEYQRLLSRTNANATRIQTPPHTTGLAFDIYYRFMTAEEQNHVMNDLARLRDEGRIEVLRENRDHFHVFAYADGKPPSESLIARSRESGSAQEEVEETPGRAKQAARRVPEKQAAKPDKADKSKRAARPAKEKQAARKEKSRPAKTRNTRRR
ncbi:MAG TPA: DUF5715 family protein [Pyrinomonadaceae bacterium]|nr:DUF5715 family protein [Pyrinomonadaceae bacterium]